MVVRAITIATAAPCVGYAAIGAAIDNKQNIACIDHTTQYFVCKAIQLWLYLSAIIVLFCGYDMGDVDGEGKGDLEWVFDDMIDVDRDGMMRFLATLPFRNQFFEVLTG